MSSPFPRLGSQISKLDETTWLGLAAVVCVSYELGLVNTALHGRSIEEMDAGLLHFYVACRDLGVQQEKEDLPVPMEFRQVFREWAEERVSFVEFIDEQ